MPSSKKQTDKRFLLFETQSDKNSDEKTHLFPPEKIHSIFSDRLVLVEEDYRDDFWYFEAFDLLMNETRRIRLPIIEDIIYKTYRIYGVYLLNDEFAFIIERDDYIQRVNLVKIDWDSSEFKLIEYVEKHQESFMIFVDKMDRSKFVFQWDNLGDPDLIWYCQVGKIVNGKIELGEVYEDRWNMFHFYSKNRLIDAFCDYPARISIYDFNSKKKETFEIDSSQLLKDVTWHDDYEWVNDRLYAAIEFLDTKKFGIACADLKTKKWAFLENFETSLGIEKLLFLNGNLIVEAKSSRYSKEVKIQIYSIPVRRPNPLRQMAWLLVVKMMKNIGEKYPYKAAKEFLPLNSDLREIWFKDEEKET